MAEPFHDQLAAGVRARRAVLRLSQRDLAGLAGVSERFVRFVEQGKRSVQLDSLLALLDTLGLELQLATRAGAAARTLAGGPTAALPDRPSAVLRADGSAAQIPGGNAKPAEPQP
jgi:HTH-type transcriptional regulator/antitoxin HipB